MHQTRSTALGTALATLGMAATLVLVVSSTPASAAPAAVRAVSAVPRVDNPAEGRRPCASYPPGVGRAVTAATLKQTAKQRAARTFTVSAFLHRGKKGCTGQYVRLYTKKVGQPYLYVGMVGTNAKGYAYGTITTKAREYVRYQWQWYYTPTKSVKSAEGKLNAPTR